MADVIPRCCVYLYDLKCSGCRTAISLDVLETVLTHRCERAGKCDAFPHAENVDVPLFTANFDSMYEHNAQHREASGESLTNSSRRIPHAGDEADCVLFKTAAGAWDRKRGYVFPYYSCRVCEWWMPLLCLTESACTRPWRRTCPLNCTPDKPDAPHYVDLQEICVANAPDEVLRRIRSIAASKICSAPAQ